MTVNQKQFLENIKMQNKAEGMYYKTEHNEI